MTEYKLGVKYPVLSIGMIFRDDIRCIERCLKALTPLRKAIPSELVMADTGSVDGSRQIAERYADKVIDFPWIDDFSAARNAVLNECTGVWNLTVDTDEYLDPDIHEIVDFLSSTDSLKCDFGFVLIRNYSSDEMLPGDGRDSYGMRLFQKGRGYEGKIHETVPAYEDNNIFALQETVFHHDGYAKERMKKKRLRNMELVEEEWSKNPENLRYISQCMDSSCTARQMRKYIERGIELIRENRGEAVEEFGPLILRNAVIEASEENYPEMEEWIQLAYERYPDSPFVQIDVALFSGNYYQSINPKRALQDFAVYWNGIKQFENHQFPWQSLYVGIVECASKSAQETAKLVCAGCYIQLEKWEDAKRTLEEVCMAQSQNPSSMEPFLSRLMLLYWRSKEDLAPLLLREWSDLVKDTSSRAEEKKQSFLLAGRNMLNLKLEEQDVPKDARPAAELFANLGEDCPLGRSALLMKAESRSEAERLLDGVEDWDYVPVRAIQHALELGARFPNAFYRMPCDSLAAYAANLVKLLGEKASETALQWVGQLPEPTLGQAMWLYNLVLSSVLNETWQDKNAENLCEAFRLLSRKCLDGFYVKELQAEEHLHLLPAALRFGWYYLQAQEMLEAGNTAEYLRLLHKGLKVAPMMKKMTEWLCSQVKRRMDQQRQIDEEMAALAQQVKQLLSAYPPDHPAVTVLKQSPVYRKVAHLLES